MWMQGHEGIQSNEIADQLSRLGSECSFIRPEPTCRISAGIAKMVSEIVGILSRTQNRQRDSYKDPLPEQARNCENKQHQLQWLTIPLTGHCHLKGYLFKMGLTKSPTCGRFPERDESATHVLQHPYKEIVHFV
jgi:hypothetical protein